MRVIFLLLFFARSAAVAASYEVQDLGLPVGYVLSRGTGLNDRGQAVGWVENGKNVSRAVLWEAGSTHLLSRDGWDESLASSINNRGQITGAARANGIRQAIAWMPPKIETLGEIDRFPRLGMPGNFVAGGSINDRSRVIARLTTRDGNQRSALWSDGTSVFFGVLADGRKCHGLEINNRDQIVGQVFDTNSHSRPFLWSDGKFRDLGSLGGTRAGAKQINERGTVIGWALPGAKLREARAFIWTEAGGLRSLGTLGGRTSRAHGLNDRDEIVGYSQTKAGSFVAFLWADGRMRDINDLIGDSEWKIVSANAINNRGQILATASLGGNKSRAVLLNPTELTNATHAKADFSEGESGDPSPEHAFRLLALERQADDAVRIEFTAWPGANYAIEVSSDLKTWTRLGVAEQKDFRNTFTDREANRATLCFYRAVRIDPTGE